jgi:hypothetical protein
VVGNVDGKRLVAFGLITCKELALLIAKAIADLMRKRAGSLE